MLPRPAEAATARGIVGAITMPTWTILLADPDPLQRQLVDMLLAQDAFDIVTAGTGREALEYLKEHTPNLAVLAIELPDVGGDVICRKLKAVKRLSQVPVILTTKPPGQGGVTHGLRQIARAVGADLLLQKPLGDKSLREKVNALLLRHQDEAPSAPRAEATKNTVILEEALQELGDGDDDEEAGVDAVTERLYRENEELRSEVAALKRQLARLESGLTVRRDGIDPPETFIPGAEPSVPEPARPPAGPTGRAEPAKDAGAPAAASPEAASQTGGDASTGEEPLPDALPADASREQLQQRVTELERRNRALLRALEDAEAQPEPPRGLFGRRRR